MIPILFEHDATEFSGHGLGDLIDSIECFSTINDTGEFELELTYPVDSRLFNELKINRIIAARAYPSEYVRVKYGNVNPVQAFRIYGYEKSINGLYHIKAQHISYDMSKIIVCPTTSRWYSEYYGKSVTLGGWPNAETLVAAINNNSYEDSPVIVYGTNPFTLSSRGYDSSYGRHLSRVSTDKPRTLRSILFDSDDSLLANFGGTVWFDNYRVGFQYSPDSDVTMTIEYGVNLIDLQQEENISEMYTGILPFAITKDAYYDGNNNHYGPESIMYGDVIYASGNFDQHLVMPLDLSQYFTKDSIDISGASTTEGMPRDKNEVNRVAERWAIDNEFGIPEVNLKIDYAHLPSQDTAFLYDLVRVRFAKLGIDALARVSSYTYDCINERCKELELGKSRSSITRSLFGNEYSRKRKELR